MSCRPPQTKGCIPKRACSKNNDSNHFPRRNYHVVSNSLPRVGDGHHFKTHTCKEVHRPRIGCGCHLKTQTKKYASQRWQTVSLEDPCVRRSAQARAGLRESLHGQYAQPRAWLCELLEDLHKIVHKQRLAGWITSRPIQISTPAKTYRLCLPLDPYQQLHKPRLPVGFVNYRNTHTSRYIQKPRQAM